MEDEDAAFISTYTAADLEIAAEFLTTWLPFLTRGLCTPCSLTLRRRIASLPSGSTSDPRHAGPRGFEQIEASGWDDDPGPIPLPSPSPDPWTPENPKLRMSWADMAQEDDELEEEEETSRKRSSQSEKRKPELSREQREQIRFRNIVRKKDFICLERINGRIMNVVDGLELHMGIFSTPEQKRIVDCVYELQEKGRNGQLGDHTYSEPRKWMKGKGRVTIQFGCCYNYAMLNGVPPGILRNVLADPIPHLFKEIIKRLVRWHVLPPSCIPDSCIVNIYEPGDCIPPHIDNHDFVRPFCTVSFVSECDILFGANLKIVGPGDFAGPIVIPLPVGSVLVLNGNGADVAKHCVPAVPTKRISITFRKMNESKLPIDFTPEPDLQNILPLPISTGDATVSQNQIPAAGPQSEQHVVETKTFRRGQKSRGKAVKTELDSHHSQPTPSDPGTPDVGPAMNNRGKGYERKPFERGLLGVYRDEEGTSMEGSSKGRKVRLEQKRIVISRNVGGEEDYVGEGREGEESSSRAGSEGYSGRRVLVDQERIVVSRSVAGEEESVRRMGFRLSESAGVSQVSVRSLNKGRRGQASLSDG